MFRIIQKMKKLRKRRWAVRPINLHWSLGDYHTKIFKSIKAKDDDEFFKHTRMSKKVFDLLSELLGNSLYKFRQRIKKEERLSITLLYLAHEQSIQSIAWSHKLGKSSVRKIILETCEILWKRLSEIYLSSPTLAQYEDIAHEFEYRWQFPNCLGAIDGKHVAIKCPNKSGSLFFNYKKHFSIVLMAVCDAKYTFTAVSVGSYGSESDGGVFRRSPFGCNLLNGTLPLPSDKNLPNTQQKFPHVFIGDAAFPLGKHLMKPYAPARSSVGLMEKETNFNYRLSRARRTIENAFGILTARWRILNTTLELEPENAEKVVLACVALHNFIMLNDLERWYCPPNYVDSDNNDYTTMTGAWREELRTIGQLSDYISHSRRSPLSAITLRDQLSEYFIKEGAVSFQPYSLI